MFTFIQRWMRWTKRRTKVTFHLKSGKTTSCWCEDVQVTHSGDKVTSYTMQNIDTRTHDPVFFIALDQIELITIDRI